MNFAHVFEQLNDNGLSDEDIPQTGAGSENILNTVENVHLGAQTRQSFKVPDNSVVVLLLKSQASRYKSYQILKDFGFCLPSFNSRCVTMNYLLGVAESIYFCPTGKLPQYEGKIKATGNAIYVEILRYANDKSLGYDTTCLPVKEYLVSVLFYCNPNHIFFEHDINNAKMLANENGLFTIPRICQNFLEIDTFNALLQTKYNISFGTSSCVKELNTIASCIAMIEKMKSELTSLKNELNKHENAKLTSEFINLKALLENLQ